jgi:hypothetical protein
MGRTVSKKAAADEYTEHWAWSAWASWRGDLRLLAHIARVAREAVEDTGSKASLHIKVVARDDWEQFSSAAEFLQGVTPQAVRRFSRLSIRVHGENCGAEVLMARKRIYEFPFNGSQGLVIHACALGEGSASPAERAKAICNRVRVAVRRGCSPWSPGLKVSETRPRTQIASHLARVGGARNAITKGFTTMLAALPFAIFAALEGLGVLDQDPGGRLTYLVIAQCAIVYFGQPLAPLVVPAIEIAEFTPARRALRLIGRSGLLSAASGLLLALIRVKSGAG